MEEVIHYMQTVSPLLVYSVMFAISYIENVFPPLPSDLVIVFGGSMIALERIEFLPSIALATAGSTLGFVTMYKIGDWFGDTILEAGKIKFIPPSSVRKVEVWFAKWGYAVIIANRFLAGTRAVVSFFAGISELSFPTTIILSFLSALAWNAILLAAGYFLGQNWHMIESYLRTYTEIVTGAILIVGIVVAVRWYLNRKEKQK